MVPKLSQFSRDFRFTSGSPCPWRSSVRGKPRWLVILSSAQPTSLFCPVSLQAYFPDFPTSSSGDPALDKSCTQAFPAQPLLPGDPAFSGVPPSLSVGQFSGGLLAVDEGCPSLPTEITARLRFLLAGGSSHCCPFRLAPRSSRWMPFHVLPRRWAMRLWLVSAALSSKTKAVCLWPLLVSRGPGPFFLRGGTVWSRVPAGFQPQCRAHP